METASLICRKLGLNPRWLILGEEPMYDAEASQERPRLTVGDLKNKRIDELPGDLQRSIQKVRKAARAWQQEWEQLPEWVKEEVTELYAQIETLEKERDEAKAELLKAKDQAIDAQNMAIQSLADSKDSIVKGILKEIEDRGFMYSTEELFEAVKGCKTAAEFEKLIKQGRGK